MVDHIISLGDIDIVTMSLANFVVDPYNGASDTSQKVNEARANGTLWINSAGNYANHQLQNHSSLQTTCLKSSECSHQSYFFKLLI